MLDHGGRLLAAARLYGIPTEGWLDLSTGINPNGWTVPFFSGDAWLKLPQDEDGLEDAAARFYGVSQVLPVAGSQAAIQSLPRLRKPSKVAIVEPGYSEHAHAWKKQRHEVLGVPEKEIFDAAENAEVVIVINPNNPTGKFWGRQELLAMHNKLAKKGGWLIVDEAFIDATPDCSLSWNGPLEGLIILRSVGKFFGLAGARVGFVLAEEKILGSLREEVGPWTIATPSRLAATLALQDCTWQEKMRLVLQEKSRLLVQVLESRRLPVCGGTPLFQWVRCPEAADLFDGLAKQGILVRHFSCQSGLRFGLPKDEEELERLAFALENLG